MAPNNIGAFFCGKKVKSLTPARTQDKKLNMKILFELYQSFVTFLGTVVLVAMFLAMEIAVWRAILPL